MTLVREPTLKASDAWKLLPDIWALIKPRRSVLAIGLVLVTINRGLSLVIPASTKYLIDDVIRSHHVELLEPLVLIVLAATLLQGLTAFGLTQVLARSALEMTADLRRRLQAHVGRLPLAFYDATKTGVLVSRIMSDVEGARAIIGIGLIQFVGSLITALVALVLLFRISATMTFVTVMMVLAFAFTLVRAFRILRPIMRLRPRLSGEVAGRLNEMLGGVRVIKGYHAEKREEEVFSSGVQRLLDNGLKTLNATAVIGFAGSGFAGLVGAVIMFLGARQILSNQMLVGTYVMYAMLAAMLTAPVSQIISLAPELLESLAALERTREILNEKPEDGDSRRNTAIGQVDGAVVFDDVGFSYDGTRDVLQNISFRADADMVTALIGPSGAGKSTIVALIAAFYTPHTGRVLVDGVDLSTVKLGSYRSQLAFVLQDTFLFDGTIRENVAFGRPDASEASIREACRIAHVDEFVCGFDAQYDTVIGERGVKLSGGQRQRVSIARAVLADRRILIMDEATSSVDTESEALIQEGLRVLMRGRTTFVIAHRLSTVRHADQILMIEGGRIVARGTHDSLYGARGHYYDLCTGQYTGRPNVDVPTSALTGS